MLIRSALSLIVASFLVFQIFYVNAEGTQQQPSEAPVTPTTLASPETPSVPSETPSVSPQPTSGPLQTTAISPEPPSVSPEPPSVSPQPPSVSPQPTSGPPQTTAIPSQTTEPTSVLSQLTSILPLPIPNADMLTYATHALGSLLGMTSAAPVSTPAQAQPTISLTASPTLPPAQQQTPISTQAVAPTAPSTYALVSPTVHPPTAHVSPNTAAATSTPRASARPTPRATSTSASGHKAPYRAAARAGENSKHGRNPKRDLIGAKPKPPSFGKRLKYAFRPGKHPLHLPTPTETKPDAAHHTQKPSEHVS